MNITKYVFVVVVYLNTEDLLELILNLHGLDIDKEIIIVNNYYDDESKNRCLKIAYENNCKFLNVDNKGYGYGNNRGIEYAIENFNFEFLIVSNPDILIKKFDEHALSNLKESVVGPIIMTSANKSQNPYWYLKNPISEWLIYNGYKHKSNFILYLGILINKLIREFFLIILRISKKEYQKVFALHGSFVIYSDTVLKKIGLPYDEEMFLFAEEAYLAHLLNKKNIDSYITKGIEVLHKEDGSMSLAKIDEKSEARKSIITYYEKLNIHKRSKFI